MITTGSSYEHLNYPKLLLLLHLQTADETTSPLVIIIGPDMRLAAASLNEWPPHGERQS